MTNKYLLIIISALLASVISGCASYPKAIAMAEADKQPDFAVVQANPQSYQGQTMVFGGIIVSVTNNTDSSVLEILQLPLYSSGHPKPDTDKAGGRLRITFTQFLDPQVYSNGRLISVRGQISGNEKGTIGEYAYTFVTMSGDGLHLWPERPDEVEVHYYMGMGLHSYYPYPVPVAPPRPKQ